MSQLACCKGAPRSMRVPITTSSIERSLARHPRTKKSVMQPPARTSCIHVHAGIQAPPVVRMHAYQAASATGHGTPDMQRSIQPSPAPNPMHSPALIIGRRRRWLRCYKRSAALAAPLPQLPRYVEKP
jgi:hypothetical protein